MQISPLESKRKSESLTSILSVDRFFFHLFHKKIKTSLKRLVERDTFCSVPIVLLSLSSPSTFRRRRSGNTEMKLTSLQCFCSDRERLLISSTVHSIVQTPTLATALLSILYILYLHVPCFTPFISVMAR